LTETDISIRIKRTPQQDGEIKHHRTNDKQDNVVLRRRNHIKQKMKNLIYVKSLI